MLQSEWAVVQDDNREYLCAIAEHIHSRDLYPTAETPVPRTRSLSFSCDWAGDIQEIVNVCGCPSISSYTNLRLSVCHLLVLITVSVCCGIQTGEWNCFPLDRHVSEFWIVSLCECSFASSFNAFKPHICKYLCSVCCLLRKHCYSRRKLYCLHAALS